MILVNSKGKKEEFLQHVITSHSLSILNVSENFEKVREHLPDLVEPLAKHDKKKETEVREAFSLVPSYNIRGDNYSSSMYPYDYELNNANRHGSLSNNHVNNNNLLDRTSFRNYLFRRRLINSEPNSVHDSLHGSNIEENNEAIYDYKECYDTYPSVKSEDTEKNFILKPINETSTNNNENNRTDMFKYYYNNNKEKEPTETKKFTDEDDYKNLYNQLVSQNMLLKTEILDKIKRGDEATVNALDKNRIRKYSFENNQFAIEEEEKEIDGKTKESESKIMKNMKKISNKLESHNVELTNKISSFNTTSSLYEPNNN